MLARAYLLTGRPLEAAETAEEALSVLTDRLRWPLRRAAY